jgi:hypothetical protein
MKLGFSLIIKGDERLESKLKHAIEDNPRLHVELIEAFTAAVVRKLSITNEDNISIESFRAAKIEEGKP